MKALLGLLLATSVLLPSGLRADDTWIGHGVIVPRHSVSLRGRAHETIVEISVDVGDRVKKGDLLIRFDDRQARLALEVARLTMKQKENEAKLAEAKMTLAKAHVDRARLDLERMRKLRDTAAISVSEIDKAEADYKHSLAEVDATQVVAAGSRLDIELAKLTMAEREMALDALAIRAPFDGVIANRRAAIGEIITRPEQTLIEMIAGPYLVEAGIPDRLAPMLKPGLPVEVTFDKEFTEKPMKGRVSRVSPLVDPRSREISVQIELAGDFPAAARPGLIIKVAVPAP